MTEREILEALERKAAEAMEEGEVYTYHLVEDFTRPAILLLPVTTVTRRVNPYLIRKTQEVQILYFPKVDEYGQREKESIRKGEEIIFRMVGDMLLSVGERKLAMTYEEGQADEEKSVFVRVDYTESSPAAYIKEREEAEKAEAVFVSDR